MPRKLIKKQHLFVNKQKNTVDFLVIQEIFLEKQCEKMILIRKSLL